MLKSVRDPFDCRASRCTVGSSQIWGWFKTILIHFVPYFEGMNMRNIHSPAILLGSPWDPMMAWVPAAIRMCDALYVWICQEPLISRSHLLGRMVGAEDLNPTAKWLNRPSLEAIQAWSGRTWPIFAPDFSRFQVTPFETMIGFETNSGAHHLPSTSNYIDYIHITIYELRTIFVT